jgi:hypothetical protein
VGLQVCCSNDRSCLQMWEGSGSSNISSSVVKISASSHDDKM